MILCIPPADAPLGPTLGPQVWAWIQKHLVHGPGDLLGEPVRDDEEWLAILCRLYEVWPQGHQWAGRRVYKRGAISRRKGRAKTEFAAWVSAAELHPRAPVRCVGWFKNGQPRGAGVKDPYIPLVAYTEEQGETTIYGALKAIVERSDVAGDLDIGLERIMRKDGTGKAEALAAEPNARDGARTTFQVFEEPLSLDTPVPTLAGWKTIGEVGPGDEVFDRRGRAVRVLGASPVHVGRACYRVTFDDGTAIVTDGSHRWTAIDWANRPRGEQPVTTEQMAASVETGYGLRWRLPRGCGIAGAEKPLPIEPYLLGLWLGDGATAAGYIHNAPEDYAELAAGIEHTVSNDARKGVVRWLPTGLRRLLHGQALIGCKRIPEIYLFASRDQRLALLRGLMDTDGHTTERGACTWAQKDRSLASQVAELVRSLGDRASLVVSPDERSRTGESCKVHFSPAVCPFRLSRKARRFSWRLRTSTRWPAIKMIEPVDSMPVRCIAVDSEDHLFQVGRGFHLTHNTHRWYTPRLKHAYQTMMLNIPKRRTADAWSLEVTTAYAPGQMSIAEATMDHARAVADGRVKDTRLFFSHRQAPDEADIATPEGLRAAVVEASGEVAVGWSDIDGICAQFDDTNLDHATLCRLWLNQIKHPSDKAFSSDLWKSRSRGAYVPPDGAQITLGFDGARYRDSTGLVGTEIKTGYQWKVGLWERPPAVEKWEVPQAEVEEAVAAAMERWSVALFFADPPYWESLVAGWAGMYGEKRVVFFLTNRWRKMADAVRSYGNAMKDGDLSHNGDPDFARHVANCHRRNLTETDDQGQPLFVVTKARPDSPDKIDLAVAGVLSWEARRAALADGIGFEEESVYERRRREGGGELIDAW